VRAGKGNNPNFLVRQFEGKPRGSDVGKTKQKYSEKEKREAKHKEDTK